MKIIKIKCYDNIMYFNYISDNFTGIAIDNYNIISFYKNGVLHNKYCKAVICGKHTGEWWYEDIFCGSNKLYNNKSWKIKVKKLERKQKLKVFK